MDGAPETGGGWTVDPDEHRTLRGVLESWAARAGWTLVWKAREDYGLGAAARPSRAAFWRPPTCC